MSQTHHKHEKMQRRIRMNGVFYASISSSSFGFSPLFSLGLLAAGLSSFDVLSYRWSVAALVLLIYSLVKKKSLKFLSFDEAWKIILLSLLRALTSAALLISYANISSGIATTINFMYPTIVAFCMMVFFGEKKSPVDFISIAATILGVYMLASGDSLIVENGNTKLGFASALVSAFSFAAYFILMKRLRADKIEVVKFNTWIMMLSAIYFILCAFIFEGRLTLVTEGRSWLNILGLGLWATMVSNITGVKAIRRIGPTRTSILGALQPLTAVILGVLFLGEHLYLRSIIGITLILVSVSIVVLHQKR